MSGFPNVYLNTFEQQYPTQMNTQTQKSNQKTRSAVNNKGLEKGDRVTIFGKEINKKKAIMGGLAILTAIAATAVLIIKGKGKVPPTPAQTPPVAPIPKPDDKTINNVTETVSKTVEQMTEKIGDDAAAAVNKAGGDIEKTTAKVVEKAEETLQNTVEEASKAVTQAESKMAETAKDAIEQITPKTDAAVEKAVAETPRIPQMAQETVEKAAKQINRGNLDERIKNMNDIDKIILGSGPRSDEVTAALKELKPETIEAISDKTIVEILRFKDNPKMSEQKANEIIQQLEAKEAAGLVKNAYELPACEEAFRALASIKRNQRTVSRIRKFETLFTPKELQAINNSDEGKMTLANWINSSDTGSAFEDEIINKLKQIALNG